MSAYTVRYPTRVTGLILLSPAGIPRGKGYDKNAPEGEKNRGDREEAADAAEMEVEGDEPVENEKVTKESAVQDKASLLKRTTMKGETFQYEINCNCTAYVFSSFHLGLGERHFTF